MPTDYLGRSAQVWYVPLNPLIFNNIRLIVMRMIVIDVECELQLSTDTTAELLT